MCAQINYTETMAKETTINVRIDQETKDKAAEIFARCGYTTSNAIRLFLLRAIKEDDWPFDVHQLGPQTMAAVEGEHFPIDNWENFIKDVQTEAQTELQSEKQAKRNTKRNAKR